MTPRVSTTGTTWVSGAAGSLYDVDNLPYGVYSTSGSGRRIGVRVGDFVLDLAGVAATDVAMSSQLHLLESSSLNRFMASGRETWSAMRAWITGLAVDESRRAQVAPFLHRLEHVELHLPIDVGDYVDFYCSLEHATNVGRIFRPDGEPLLPNWRHLPVGYHGRAGTIVVSGRAVQRPNGQLRPAGADSPTHGPSSRLDLEAELGFVIGKPSSIGQPIQVDDFGDHVFGVLPLNDWSARDIQAWEYVPLGPFLGKSFATSVAAWVTPLEALENARIDVPRQEPAPLAYLEVGHDAGYDVDFEVLINGHVVSRPSYRDMYWSPAQMLAHMTVNGASVRSGDLYGSGTISGRAKGQRGSLLELSWGGSEPFEVNGAVRTFLEDGDEVVLRATAPGKLGRLGLGEVRGVVASAAGGMPPGRCR